jgi:hypothetical protein
MMDLGTIITNNLLSKSLSKMNKMIEIEDAYRPPRGPGSSDVF